MAPSARRVLEIAVTSGLVAPSARRVLEMAVLARGAGTRVYIYSVAFSDIFKLFFRVCSQSKD